MDNHPKWVMVILLIAYVVTLASLWGWIVDRRERRRQELKERRRQEWRERHGRG